MTEKKNAIDLLIEEGYASNTVETALLKAISAYTLLSIKDIPEYKEGQEAVITYNTGIPTDEITITITVSKVKDEIQNDS